jgi:hypothetical protein
MRKNPHLLTGLLRLVTVGFHAQTTTITGKITDAAGASPGMTPEDGDGPMPLPTAAAAMAILT